MRLSLIFLGLVLAGNLAADYYDDFYFKVSGGAVFPGRNSSVSGGSSTKLFPSSQGVSLFSLPEIKWKNTYQTGYEVSAALGCSPICQWRCEAEFLYQNFTRKISGTYTWREVATTSQMTFDEQSGNPIKEASNKAQVYSVLANFIHDIPTCTPLTFTIGGGAGVAWLHSRSTTNNNILAIHTLMPVYNQTLPTIEKSPRLFGTAFAWQFLFGINYDCPANLSVGIGYRLFGTTRFQGSSSSIETNPGLLGDTVFVFPQKDIRGLLNSSVNVSLSYRF